MKMIAIQMTFKKLYLKSGNEFGILSIEFWIKHYQQDLGKMKFCEYKPISIYTRVQP